MTAQAFTLFETAIGHCGIAWSDRGIVGVQLPEGSEVQTRARLRPVTLGRTYGNRIEVTTGVRQGEQVVVSGPSMLNDGDAIRVIP